MAITIQDLIASDTISQAVDKINFNFDQLLLNGGGPSGPLGPIGPSGPIGGRGERGSEWYDGSALPNTLIIAGLIEGDYYLQSDGTVWEYNGTLWIDTTINLTGPTGTPGTSDGWLYIGNDGSGNVLPANKNTLYPSGMPGGSGATATNRGVPMVLVAGVTTNTPTVGYTYTSEYQLTDTMTGSLDSTLVSMLIHQKNSSAKAITFMGGGNAVDNFEQNDIAKLSSIYLGNDDTLNIVIPKVPTVLTDPSQAFGFNLFTGTRGANFRAGRMLNFVTGAMGATGGQPFLNANVNFELNEINTALPPGFIVNVLGSSSAYVNVGQTTVPAFPNPFNGQISLGADNIRIDTANTVKFNSDIGSYEFNNVPETGTGYLALLDGSSKLTKVAIGGAGFQDGVLSYDSSIPAITSSTGSDGYITSWDGSNALGNENWRMDTNSIYPEVAGQDLGRTSQGIHNIFLGGDTAGGQSVTNIFTYPYPASAQTAVVDIRSSTSQTGGIARFRNEFNVSSGLNTGTTILQLGLSSGERLVPNVPYYLDLPNTVLGFGTEIYTDPTPTGNSSGRSFPKITFSPYNGSGSSNPLYNNEPSGIYMNSGAKGYYATNSPLVMKGSNGSLTTSSSGSNRGKYVMVNGGNAGTSSGQVGGVYIGAGANRNISADSSTTNYMFGGEAVIGYDFLYDTGGANAELNIAKRSTRRIVIGAPSTSPANWSEDADGGQHGAFTSIINPPRSTFGTNPTYTLAVVNNKYDNSNSWDDNLSSFGGFTLRNKSNKYGIDLFTGLTTDAYNPRVEGGDSLLLARNNFSSSTKGKPGGFVIGLKDQPDSAIRFDGQGYGSDWRFVNGAPAGRILFYGGRPDGNSGLNPGAPRQPGQEAFVFDGRQTFTPPPTTQWAPVVFQDRNDSAIVSGIAYPNSLAGTLNGGYGSSAGYLTWLKIGHVIHLQGQVNYGSGTGQRVISVPAIGGNVTSLRGHGTGWNGSNIAVEIHSVTIGGAEGFAAKYNGSWFGASNGNYRFSIMYTIA